MWRARVPDARVERNTLQEPFEKRIRLAASRVGRGAAGGGNLAAGELALGAAQGLGGGVLALEQRADGHHDLQRSRRSLPL